MQTEFTIFRQIEPSVLNTSSFFLYMNKFSANLLKSERNHKIMNRCYTIQNSIRQRNNSIPSHKILLLSYNWNWNFSERSSCYEIAFCNFEIYKLKLFLNMFSVAQPGEANGQLPISFWAVPIEIFISRLLPSEILFIKIYLLMNWIANVVFCLFRSHSHILISFQYISTSSTFSAYCQIKNFSPSKKNLAHFVHCLFLHIRSLPIGRKILVAPLYVLVWMSLS